MTPSLRDMPPGVLRHVATVNHHAGARLLAVDRAARDAVSDVVARQRGTARDVARRWQERPLRDFIRALRPLLAAPQDELRRAPLTGRTHERDGGLWINLQRYIRGTTGMDAQVFRHARDPERDRVILTVVAYRQGVRFVEYLLSREEAARGRVPVERPSAKLVLQPHVRRMIQREMAALFRP